MKRTKFIVLASAAVWLLAGSCTKKEYHNIEAPPYYQFTEDDRSKLITGYSQGKELIYKNQKGDQIRFNTLSYKEGKSSDLSGSFWDNHATKNFDYDRQEIEMQYEGASPVYKIYLNRYPFGSNYNVYPPVTGTSNFFGYLEFPAWNVYSDTFSASKTLILNFDLPVISKTINDKMYNKVIMIESGSLQTLEPSTISGGLPQNVNKIFYDENNGIIEFDDVEGNTWQLQ